MGTKRIVVEALGATTNAPDTVLAMVPSSWLLAPGPVGTSDDPTIHMRIMSSVPRKHDSEHVISFLGHLAGEYADQLEGSGFTAGRNISECWELGSIFDEPQLECHIAPWTLSK